MTEFERKRIDTIRESATGKITTICFVIDLSGSMSRFDEVDIGGGRIGTKSRIDRINDTIELFLKKLKEERDYRNFDICIIGYNEKPKIYNKFTFCDAFIPATLRVEMNGEAGSGKGDTGTAIKAALNLIDKRKKEYIEEYGLTPKKIHRPWLIVFSDGRPTCNDGDNVAYKRMMEAARMVNERERNAQINPIPVFIGTTSDDAKARKKGLEAMDSLSSQKGRYIDIDGDNISLDEFISTLAKSISSNTASLIDKHRTGNINSIQSTTQKKEIVLQKEQPVEAVEPIEEEEEEEIENIETIRVYIRSEADVEYRRDSTDSFSTPIHRNETIKEEPKPVIKEEPKAVEKKVEELDENDDGEPEIEQQPVVEEKHEPKKEPIKEPDPVPEKKEDKKEDNVFDIFNFADF